jgi:hypothetical protein
MPPAVFNGKKPHQQWIDGEFNSILASRRRYLITRSALASTLGEIA